MLSMPSSAVVQQGVEDRTGLVAITGEVVSLAHLRGALATGEGRPAKGHVADQVEGVVVATHVVGDGVEQDALLLQLADDRPLLVGGAPVLEEVVQGGVAVGAPVAV
jgi:hypothetical protein